MRRMLPACSFALLLAASAALGAEQAPATWIDQVRNFTVRSLKDIGGEIKSVVATMHRGMAGLKDDTAKGLRAITREGRRGLDSASKSISHAAGTVFRETHETFLLTGRTLVPGVATKPRARSAAVTRTLQSPILQPYFLRGHDILLAWHLDTGDRPIRTSAMFEDRLLLETDDHDLYSFQPASGILQWLYNLPAASQSGYVEDPQNVICVSKDIYYELDKTVGRPRRRIVLPFPASNPPALRGEVEVLLNSWERRIIALNRDTRVREWSYAPETNVVGAVAVAPDLIYIADVAGNLVCYSVPAKQERWTYKAHDAFRVTPIFHLVGDHRDVIVPAEDLFVHCVNRFSGLAHWKYPVQGPVSRPVWADGDVVCFSADGDAFYAVSAKDGKLLWRCPRGGWPVAIGRENLYLQGPDQEVWCLDRKTGEKRWAVSAKPFVYFVHNTVNDHIYLCTEEGEVYAFYLRGDHIEKAAPPPEKKPKAKGKGVEAPEPGGLEPSERPATKPKMPTPRLRPPAKEKAEEAVEEPAPGEPPKTKAAEEEEGAPAVKLPETKSKAPAGEKTPAEIEEQEEKAKAKGKE